MFKFENQSVLFDPKIGDELILNGNISIYAPSEDINLMLNISRFLVKEHY